MRKKLPVKIDEDLDNNLLQDLGLIDYKNSGLVNVDLDRMFFNSQSYRNFNGNVSDFDLQSQILVSKCFK